MASNLHYPAMQAAISEAAAMEVMPVGCTIAVMVAMNETDLCLL